MDGILLFNKPLLWTSHDAVDFMRRRLGQRKVGHAGALDPMATGLLVILLGQCTKKSQEFSLLDKDYSGSMTLGITTDTQDLEGKIIRRAASEAVKIEEADLAISKLRGAQWQRPPAFSSCRKDGKKLYSLARKGIMIEAEAREIFIKDFRILNFCPPEIHFFLSCSKGTYVRSLCDEVGKKLGCGATLSSLVRTRVGSFHLTEAATDGQIQRLTREQIEKKLTELTDENISRN